MSRLVDLSHMIEHGTITYKGLPAPIICDYLSREASKDRYAEGVSFHIGRIDMVANTGTYLDSPFHRFEDGADLAQLKLESLANLPGIVFSFGGREITPDLFGDTPLAGKAVLIQTGWDKFWGSDAYFDGNPYINAAAAAYLRDAEAALVGIDSLNIDNADDTARPAHSILLGADIPIVEHMCGLNQLPREGFKFYAVPVKVKGFGTFPVRAFAQVEEQQA